MSLEALDAATERRARDRDRRHGRDDRPRRDRPARRARRPRARAAAPGSTSTPRSAPGSLSARASDRASRASSARTASPPTCTSCGGCRSAPARCSCPDVGVLQGRPPRQRLPQPPRGRGRGPAQPRRPLARHVAALRRAEGPDRAARHRPPPARPRWSTRCSRSPSTPASAIERAAASSSCSRRRARSWSRSATAATTRSTSASTATCSPPARAVIGRTRVNGEVGAQAHAAEPAHDAARTSTRCWTRSSAREPHRQLDGADLAGRVAHAAGDPDRLERARAAWSAAAGAARSTRLAASERFDLRARERLLGSAAGRSGAPRTSSPGRTTSLTSVVRLRSSRGVARAFRNGAPATSTGGPRRAAAPRPGRGTTKIVTRQVSESPTPLLTR